MPDVPGWEGRFFEDFAVGDVYVHRLGRTVLEVDNVWFTLLTQNTAPIHFDRHYAAGTEFGRPLVDSTFTLALVTGQSVADVSQNVMANLGWDEVRLPGPGLRGRHDLLRVRGRRGPRVALAAERRHRDGAHDGVQPGRGGRHHLHPHGDGLPARPRAGGAPPASRVAAPWTRPVTYSDPRDGPAKGTLSMQEAEKIWMNGALVDWPDARVHVLSHGLHYGTTVFEGIRSYDAEGGTAVFRLDDHLARLERSASMYHMPIPYSREELRQAVHSVLTANGLSGCYIRPIVLRGYGTMGLFPLEAPVDVAIAAWEWGAYLGEDGLKTGIRAKISSWRRIGSSTIPATAKAGGQYLNSILAKIETHKAGYQEAILLNEAGYVADGSGENIFVVRDGVLITPPMHASILEGITRASIMTLARDEGIPVRRARHGAAASSTTPTRSSSPAPRPRCAR